MFNQATIIISTISTEILTIRALSKEVNTRIIKRIVILGVDFTIEVIIYNREAAKTKIIKAEEEIIVLRINKTTKVIKEVEAEDMEDND